MRIPVEAQIVIIIRSDGGEIQREKNSEGTDPVLFTPEMQSPCFASHSLF